MMVSPYITLRTLPPRLKGMLKARESPIGADTYDISSAKSSDKHCNEAELTVETARIEERRLDGQLLRGSSRRDALGSGLLASEGSEGEKEKCRVHREICAFVKECVESDSSQMYSSKAQ